MMHACYFLLLTAKVTTQGFDFVVLFCVLCNDLFFAKSCSERKYRALMEHYYSQCVKMCVTSDFVAMTSNAAVRNDVGISLCLLTMTISIDYNKDNCYVQSVMICLKVLLVHTV